MANEDHASAIAPAPQRSCYSCEHFLICHARTVMWRTLLELPAYIDKDASRQFLDDLGVRCALYRLMPEKKEPAA